MDSFLVAFTSALAVKLEAEWTQIQGKPRISPPRSGHTAFSADPTSPTFIFGGYIEEGAPEDGSNSEYVFGNAMRKTANDLWKFDQGKQQWECVAHSGDIPQPRLATAAAVVNDKAYLIGGWDSGLPGTGGEILDSVHELDLKTAQWTELAGKVPDGPTSRHVALALSGANANKILIHNHRCIDHVWLFDTETKQFVKQSTTGQGPGSVGLHTATMVDDVRMLVFGGAVKDGTMSNKCHVLNTDTWTWHPVTLGDPKLCPTPRAGAYFCAVPGQNCAILFGGAETTPSGLNGRGDLWAMHVDNDSSGNWQLLMDDADDKNESAQPPPRNALTLSQIASEDAATSKYLLTGGWAPFKKTWDDVYILSVQHKSRATKEDL